MNKILNTLNEYILQENGIPVVIGSKWSDAELDSFGTTMVMADMDNEYECFPKEWFSTVEWKSLTIKEIVEKVINESPKLQIHKT